MRRALLPVLFLALLTAGRSLADYQTQATTQAKFQRKAEPGVFPEQWNFGECGSEPPIQSHAYNDDFFILRQSKCTSYEAPFMYLVFGQEKVLLLDTGATSSLPLQIEVQRIIGDWLERNGRDSIDLLVAHTHSHGDHVAADPQFVSVAADHVGHSLQNVKDYYGLPDWPEGQATLDLGGRILDVLPTPGHHPAEVSFYDRRTQLFLSGDIIYPGHLFIFTPGEWPQFVASIDRIAEFTKQNPIRWIVGCHVEMTDMPGVPYPYTTPVQPDEHTLHFAPSILADLQAAAASLGSDADCTIFDEFVIHPLYKCGFLWNG